MTVRRLGPPRALLRALLRQGGSPEDIGEAAAACREEREAEDVLQLLLALLVHQDPVVRAGACHGLAGHPYPVAWRALFRVSQRDASSDVRKAAEVALETHDAAPLECIECGVPATLKPEPSSDPHGVQLVYPIFCSAECAVTFALERARDEFHRCAPDGQWHAGPEAECGVCQDYERLGAPEGGEPPEPGPTMNGDRAVARRHRSRRG